MNMQFTINTPKIKTNRIIVPTKQEQSSLEKSINNIYLRENMMDRLKNAKQCTTCGK